MIALGVENAHNERPKIKTCWCIQINRTYLYVFLNVMAVYGSSRNKLTLEVLKMSFNLPRFGASNNGTFFKIYQRIIIHPQM